MSPPTPDELEKKSIAIALEAVARLDAAPVERRAVPAREGEVDWSPVLLRRVAAQPVAVYDPLGEVEIVLDRTGTIRALDDPRHEPVGGAVHVSEVEAVAAVRALMGAVEIDLMADLIRTRDGKAYLKVKNRAPREDRMQSKFFKREEPEEPKGPPPDRIEALVNAASGRVYSFRREPPPPPEEGST